MENGKHIKVLTLQFDAEISSREIVLFRGAVLKSIGDGVDILFHNHSEENGFRYSYPLIQYKRLGRKAAIVCVDQGVDSIGQFLMSNTNEITLGDRVVKLEMHSIKPQNVLVQTWQSDFKYKLQHWLPLNSDNYQKFQAMNSLTDRISLLETILKGNLLSMCKGLGIYLSEQVSVSISRLSEPHWILKKKVKVMSFDVDFCTNLSIPDGIGVGKDVSIGYGTIRKERKKEMQTNNQDNDESN